MTTAPWHWRARWLAGITFPASQRHGVSYCEYVSHAGGETVSSALALVSVTAKQHGTPVRNRQETPQLDNGV